MLANEPDAMKEILRDQLIGRSVVPRKSLPRCVGSAVPACFVVRHAAR
jgi:hypothetical protein